MTTCGWVTRRGRGKCRRERGPVTRGWRRDRPARRRGSRTLDIWVDPALLARWRYLRDQHGV